MNTSLNNGSARIYQFPPGGRGGRRHEEAKTAIDLAPSRIYDAASSSSWYHEAAIEESKPVRER
jgi:Protein of unknown function (DUF2735)